MNHWTQNNPMEPPSSGNNVFTESTPELSHVPCEPPNCPFVMEDIISLDERISSRFDSSLESMNVRRLIWIEALSFCSTLYQNHYLSDTT
jgi:hypothetical protein